MARSITSTHRPVLEAFLAGKSKTRSNTATDGTNLTLYGNRIAFRDGRDAVLIVPGRRNTATTRNRLTALVSLMGAGRGVGNRKGAPHLGDAPMAWDDYRKAWTARVAGVFPAPEPVEPAAEPAYDHLGAMIAWENGELDQDGTVELFQHLISSGMVQCLQGCYGRQADALIQAGLCHA